MASPQNPATLEETDLSAFDFETSLEKKVYGFVSEMEWRKMKKKTAINKSISKVSSDVVLRKKKRSTQPDQRCRSPSNYVEKGFIKSKTSVDEENLEILRNDLPSAYHNEQSELFAEVKKTFPELFNFVEQFQDNKGLWQLRSKKDNKPYSTVKFVHFVDKITKRFSEELRKAESQRKELNLTLLYDCCEKIAMGRYLADLLSSIDLLDQDETKSWQNHAKVLISFGALLVILDMLKGDLNGDRKVRKRKQNYLWVVLVVFLLLFVFLGVFYLLLKFYNGLSRLEMAYLVVLLVSRCVAWLE